MPLSLTPSGAEFIARFEGYRSVPYRCPAGRWTIGYGHVIQPHEHLARVSTHEALELLRIDADREANPVSKALAIGLLPHQADALISLAFNCGGRAIARSTLVRKLNEGDPSAPSEFLRWNKIGRAESRGLTNRRNAEYALFVRGDYEGRP